MTRRFHSIDALRGLAIVGMVLCASISWNCGLPAWMFHCQTPPPSYEFNPDVRGLTWVDLVFPFFLVAMGMSISFSLTAKKDKGLSNKAFALSLARRWFTLFLFSETLGNAYRIFEGTGPDFWKGIFMNLVWVAYFLSFISTRKKWVNNLGLLAIAVMFAAEKFLFHVDISLQSSDIIIKILCWVSLVGNIVCLLAKNHSLRWLIFAFVLAVKAVSYYTGALDFLAVPDKFTWFFDWSYLDYLLIIIPASIFADWLVRYSRDEQAQRNEKPTRASYILPVVILIQLWGLFTRNVAIDLVLTIAAALSYVLLTYKNFGIDRLLAYLGFCLLIAGIIFDPIDGGIAKDYCTISYLLVTGGMGTLVCSYYISREQQGHNYPVLQACGQNPLIAYSINNFVIIPLLTVVGLMQLIQDISSRNVILGVGQGLLLTSLVCLATYMFTKKKIFWKS